ncbi:MAG TPA: ComF family protein, partial [Candidatus Yonathbacteria bacterium]|nr:ComF family protein [Candidatus Yonathbacteria bacterium]
IFAPEMRKKLDSMFPNEEVLLIPIPLSRKRRWSRGFNQAEVLARAISEAEQPTLILSTALRRTKHNNPQTLIKNKDLRLQNMRGVFEVRNPKEITGKRIIVIDDITTTGATLHEATKVLKKAGAKEAIGFAVAH